MLLDNNMSRVLTYLCAYVNKKVVEKAQIYSDFH